MVRKSAAAAAVIEAPEPQLDLPQTRDGRKPAGMKSKVNGAGNRINSPHNINDTVRALVELKVRQTGHEQTDDGLLYVETLKVTDLFVLDNGDGAQLIADARERARENGGEPTLEHDGKKMKGGQVVTDAAGVVMTPSERADAGLPPLPGEDTRTPEELAAAAKADREVHDDLAAKRASKNPDEPPYVDWFDIGAAEIVARLKATTDRSVVLAVGDFEEEHRARSSVMTAAMKRSAELMKSET